MKADRMCDFLRITEQNQHIESDMNSVSAYGSTSMCIGLVCDGIKGMFEEYEVVYAGIV